MHARHYQRVFARCSGEDNLLEDCRRDLCDRGLPWHTCRPGGAHQGMNLGEAKQRGMNLGSVQISLLDHDVLAHDQPMRRHFFQRGKQAVHVLIGVDENNGNR